MTTIVQKLKLIIGDATLRNRVLFVLGALVIFRFFANIPIPAALGQNLTALISQNQALGFLNLLTGGGLSPLSLAQGYGLLAYLSAQNILPALTPLDYLINISIVVAGSLFLMWIGELI